MRRARTAPPAQSHLPLVHDLALAALPPLALLVPQRGRHCPRHAAPSALAATLLHHHLRLHVVVTVLVLVRHHHEAHVPVPKGLHRPLAQLAEPLQDLLALGQPQRLQQPRPLRRPTPRQAVLLHRLPRPAHVLYLVRHLLLAVAVQPQLLLVLARGQQTVLARGHVAGRGGLPSRLLYLAGR